MANILDSDTAEVLSDGEEVRNLILSRGWAVIKSKLDEKVLDLQNINNLNLEQIETVAQQIAARKMASDLIFTWLQNDVFGFAEQQEVNSQSFREKNDSSFIDRA